MPDIANPIDNLINAASAEKKSFITPLDEPVVSISTRASRATFVYERMRNAMDYKEEHLLRRNAIERILKRLLGTRKRGTLAENLVTELIHARYLPNHAIPQKRLKHLEKVIDKYLALLDRVSLKEAANPSPMPAWIIGIMATDIDEFLVPPYVMHASINAMYSVITERLHLEDEISPLARRLQIYISVSRMLYKNDDDTLRYHLLLVRYPEWKNADEKLISEIGDKIEQILAEIDQELDHPLREKINTVMRKHVAYFIILRQIIVKDPEAARLVMKDGSALDELVKKACHAHYQEARARLSRSITRSVVYLVLTKFLLAIILEVPIEYWLLGEFHLIPLAVNLLFPPLLLFTIASSTRLPDEKNTERIARGIEDIVRNSGKMIQVGKQKRRSLILTAVFMVLYGVLFVLSFGVLVSILQAATFSWISILIFLFFLSLVSLFAYRIRRSSQELIVTPPLGGFIKSLWEFLTIPILHAGKWMSGKFSKINIFIFVLDFIIEAPFKSFVKITEDWMNYVHEKKEEI